MSEETHTPKQQPVQKDISTKIEKGQLNDSRNYSERVGDLKNKAEGHYAKPFINEIIQPTPTDKGNNSTANTSKDASE